jgi:hypothetical protein
LIGDTDLLSGVFVGPDPQIGIAAATPGFDGDDNALAITVDLNSLSDLEGRRLFLTAFAFRRLLFAFSGRHGYTFIDIE